MAGVQWSSEKAVLEEVGEPGTLYQKDLFIRNTVICKIMIWKSHSSSSCFVMEML